MFTKTLASLILASFIFICGTAEAYDLPIIKAEKKQHSNGFSRNLNKKTSPQIQKKKTIGKSDWKTAELFEKKIKMILESGKEISPAASERIAEDENYIFVGFYKDQAYFLDKYSLKIEQDSDGKHSWQQSIFPIGKKVLPINAKSTKQNFYCDGENIYNSLKPKDDISEIKNDDDKIFLEECFKVGYYYAFGEEFSPKK